MTTWTETTSEQFTVPIDFPGIIAYGLNEEDTILETLREKVVGKNYMGFFIIRITSIENIGAPYMHAANELIVTPLVSFTADCVRLTPHRVIPDVMMGDKNLGRRVISGGEVNVIYTDKGADFPRDTVWPTLISSVSHHAYSSKIIVTGSILAPSSPSFFMHDSSVAPHPNFIIARREPRGKEAEVVFNKLRVLYEIPSLGGAEVTSFDHTAKGTDEAVYTSAGPMGPLYHLPVGSGVGGMTWKDIKDAVTHVNIYDIEGMMADARNAVVSVAEEYTSNDEGKKRVAPYLSYVKNEMLRVKKHMAKTTE
jgi:hypothetical protein